MEQLKKGFKQVENEALNAVYDTNPDDKFKTIMTSFIESKKGEIDDLEVLANTLIICKPLNTCVQTVFETNQVIPNMNRVITRRWKRYSIRWWKSSEKAHHAPLSSCLA